MWNGELASSIDENMIPDTRLKIKTIGFDAKFPEPFKSAYKQTHI